MKLHELFKKAVENLNCEYYPDCWGINCEGHRALDLLEKTIEQTKIGDCKISWVDDDNHWQCSAHSIWSFYSEEKPKLCPVGQLVVIKDK